MQENEVLVGEEGECYATWKNSAGRTSVDTKKLKAKYSDIYQQTQIVCSVSGQEGGPVSFLEGMACGCLMLSVPTGFVTDLQLSDVACWTMPILASEKHWAGEITRILRDHPFVTDEEQIARQTFLLDAQFSSLAQQLVQICWPTDEPAKIFAPSDE